MTSPPPFQRRRKNPSKRRRSRLRQVSPPEAEPEEKTASFRPDWNVPTSRTQKKKGGKIKVVPRVEGYEEDYGGGSIGERGGGDYSEEGLRKLRLGTGSGGRKTVDGAKMEVDSVVDVGNGGWNLVEIKRGMDGVESPRGRERGGRCLADPFSEEWNGGTGRGEKVEDPDLVVVDDFTGVENADFIPLEGGLRGEMVDMGGVESDAEWEAELLRRAGQKGIKTEINREVEGRARRVVREADERVGRGARGALGKCIKTVLEAKDEWEKRRVVGEENLKRLEVAVETGEGEKRKAEMGVQGGLEKARFYRRLAEHIDDVVDMLKNKKEDILKVRKRVLEGLQDEAENVRRALEGGEDEFGRMREGRLDIEIREKLPVPKVDVLADVVEEVRGVEKLIEMFGEWKRIYGDDYMGAFGDIGLGKLAGRLVLANGGVDFAKVKKLTGVQRKEMWKAADGGTSVAGLIRAGWLPRVKHSCMEFGEMGKEVLEAGVTGGERVVEAFQERGEWEMTACMKLGDGKAAVECFKGVVIVVRMLGKDVGVRGMLGGLEQIGVGDEVLRAAGDEMGWIAEGGDGFATAESSRVARMVCARIGKE